jgi:pimeloyl-ACP methyl ester carboxylesterase
MTMTAKRWSMKLAIAAALILALPGLLNTIRNDVLRLRYPVPGEFYLINGRQMHLYCTGSGFPTVVLDAGGGNDWLIWQRVQPELSKTQRVCSYDRAGVGWSELQPGVGDASHLSTELHELLKQAGENGPFVVVAASVAGFYARQYVDRYPPEVGGLVLVDSSTPEQIQAIPGSAYSAELIKRKHREVTLEWWKEASGWALLTGDCEAQIEPGLEAYADFARAETCRPSYATSWRREADQFWNSADEAARARCCNDLPLLIVSQDPDNPQSSQPASIRSIWNNLQERLKTLSPRAYRVIARGSGHGVMIDRPDVVIQGIREISAVATGQHVASHSFGTTSSE